MKHLLFIALAITVLACTTSSDAQQIIQAAEFEKIMTTDTTALVLDVRTPEEFAEGHLQGAHNIDINSPGFKSQVSSLDKTKHVLVYCAAGVRSSKAASQMIKMGFKKVYNLDGGIKSWAASGKKIVQ